MAGVQRWQCMVCGYEEEGATPPDECPVCGAPWAAFDRLPIEAEEFVPEVLRPRPAGFRYVVVGNSSAGRSAAQSIRRLCPDARVTVLTEESVPFYYRPVLPDLISGMEESRLFSAAKGVYADDGLEIRLGERVERVDVAARVLRCRSGAEVPFDGLVIASGSAPIMIPWPGSDAEGIAYFRTFDDARAIADLCAGARRAVVVGGGLLGLEFVRAFL
ncbi:MAG: FAD-dependent oxidoreductase, partial [Armatimonadota bacterium]|nr:FAD-dependent oxidoreductase [Armatimonadota bacterium]